VCARLCVVTMVGDAEQMTYFQISDSSKNKHCCETNRRIIESLLILGAVPVERGRLKLDGTGFLDITNSTVWTGSSRDTLKQTDRS